jgi:hypothetical protein
LRRGWKRRRNMLVKVEDVQLTYTKPKINQIVYQYIIVVRDEFGHAEVFIVDVDKFDKTRFEDLVKQKYIARYRIPKDSIEVKWIVELPRVQSK